MSFDSWCQLHLNEVRRKLKAFMVESYQRRIVKERDITYWQRYYALERQVMLTNQRPR